MNVQSKPGKLIKGATGDWEVIIGLEVHAQVSSKAKLFSGASTEFGGEANAHVSLVDAAMPGMLPGYQISQYKSPIVGEGEVVVDLPDGEIARIGIERLHLEQDAGKSLH